MTVTAVLAGRRARAARPRRGSSSLTAPLVILGGFVLLAVVGPLLVTQDPLAQSLSERLAAPSGEHWLGTDDFGRDVFTRLVHAARIDLVVGIAGAALPLLIGSTLGALGGFFGGWLDTLVMRLGDLVLAFPVYVLIIALVAVLEPGASSVVIAFALVGWVPYARLLRGEVRRTTAEDFVTAARLGGLSPGRILVRHVLKNSIRPTISYAMLDIMAVILTLAAFSYLGLGVQPPAAEWGAMVATGQAYVQDSWWLVAAPGACVALLGLGFLLLGEVLDDRAR